MVLSGLALLVGGAEAETDAQLCSIFVGGKYQWCMEQMAGLHGLAAQDQAERPTGLPWETKQARLMLFGGDDHKVYLGCLNCAVSADGSVSNTWSPQGFDHSMGVWSHFGDYRNRFSSVSACNPAADDPPVIVDTDGNYYGRFSVTERRKDSVCAGDGNAYCAVVTAMCNG